MSYRRGADVEARKGSRERHSWPLVKRPVFWILLAAAACAILWLVEMEQAFEHPAETVRPAVEVLRSHVSEGMSIHEVEQYLDSVGAAHFYYPQESRISSSVDALRLMQHRGRPVVCPTLQVDAYFDGSGKLTRTHIGQLCL